MVLRMFVSIYSVEGLVSINYGLLGWFFNSIASLTCSETLFVFLATEMPFFSVDDFGAILFFSRIVLLYFLVEGFLFPLSFSFSFFSLFFMILMRYLLAYWMSLNEFGDSIISFVLLPRFFVVFCIFYETILQFSKNSFKTFIPFSLITSFS